jgi:hypothetical protein
VGQGGRLVPAPELHQGPGPHELRLGLLDGQAALGEQGVGPLGLGQGGRPVSVPEQQASAQEHGDAELPGEAPGGERPGRLAQEGQRRPGLAQAGVGQGTEEAGLGGLHRRPAALAPHHRVFGESEGLLVAVEDQVALDHVLRDPGGLGVQAGPFVGRQHVAVDLQGAGVVALAGVAVGQVLVLVEGHHRLAVADEDALRLGVQGHRGPEVAPPVEDLGPVLLRPG